MRAFFEPESVVLIGVPRQTGPGAYNNLEMLFRYGYQGQVYVVHPQVTRILGRETFPSVAALPATPELAVISVGRDRVPSVFAQCMEKGIRRVIVISQGFGDADDRGKELQRDLCRMAQENGARLLGPNTMGILNAFKEFSTAFVDIVKDPAPPPLSIVAQSGVLQVGYECFTGRLGKAIDIGNGADVDFVDALEYLETDPQTQVIAIHMEGLLRGREFLRTACRVALKKPIVLLKTGTSAAGAQAALSHTGSLVGEDALLSTAFEKAGLVRVRNMLEMRAVCRAFLQLGRIDGPRLGVLTATGAAGIMAADGCDEHGLQLAPFPEALRGELEDARIAWHRLRNPVDLWPLGMVSGSFRKVFVTALSGFMAGDEVDGVLAISAAMPSPLHHDLNLAEAVREALAHPAKKKPLALWLYGGDQARQAVELEKIPRVACFDTLDEACMGLGGMWRYEILRKNARVGGEEAFASPPGQRAAQAPSAPGKTIVGGEGFELLSRYAIAAAPQTIVREADAAVQAAGEMGYPVVLKIISPQWLHKSDRGGIRLNVASAVQLRDAMRDLNDLFQRETPDGVLEGIQVQKQLHGVELLLGIKRDPQLGPVLVAGMGGIYTEIFRDTARGLVPIAREDARAMLRSLRIYPLLEGVRGQKGVKVDAVVETMLSLSRLAWEMQEILEMDLNPVIAREDGCWAVDCRIVLG